MFKKLWDVIARWTGLDQLATLELPDQETEYDVPESLVQQKIESDEFITDLREMGL